MTTTINASTVSGLVNSADTSGILQLQTASTAALTIDASQNVGIGTASPAQKLHVSDTTTSTVKTRTEASTGYVDVGMGGNSGVFDTTATDGIRLRTSGNDRLAIDTSGNVGIGTTSPGSKLYTQLSSATAYSSGVTGNGLTIYNSSATTGQYVGITLQGEPTTGNGGLATIMGTTTGSGNMDLTFSTRGSATLAERMRVPSDGGIRVGMQNYASAPSSTNYGVLINNTNSGSRFFGQGSGTETQIEFGNTNGTRGSIQTNSTNTLYNTTSDYRLKENVVPMANALATVLALKPCTYKWKVDGSNGQGFIAHELQAVVPDCVTGEKDAVDENGDIKPQFVDTSFLVATLTAAIQEQQATINALTARLVALEK